MPSVYLSVCLSILLPLGLSHMLSSARCALQLTPLSHKGVTFSGLSPQAPPLPSTQGTSYQHFYFRADGSVVSPPGGHAWMTWLVGCCCQAPGSHSFPLLSPQHVFCEECLCLWLDRERTCPLCRSVAVDTLRCWKDGATSAHLQVY